MVTPEEIGTQVQGRHKARLLERFDTDGDGALSASELDRMRDDRRGKRAARMFDRFNADDSGSLTLVEMSAHHDPARLIAKFDTDNDGALSAEEFANARGHAKRTGAVD